jgi:hypothetical protein
MRRSARKGNIQVTDNLEDPVIGGLNVPMDSPLHDDPHFLVGRCKGFADIARDRAMTAQREAIAASRAASRAKGYARTATIFGCIAILFIVLDFLLAVVVHGR